jgi:hypothetical protein
MQDLLEDSVYGLRLVGEQMLLGNSAVRTTKNGYIRVADKSFRLTEGICEILQKKQPIKYTQDDLKTYKELLFLTNAHRRYFDSSSPINANRSYKYKQIISKLFLPKRSYAKQHANKSKLDLLSLARQYNHCQRLISRSMQNYQQIGKKLGRLYNEK